MAGRASRVVIVGVSTRALAESAVRAGRTCLAVDAFGDRDQKAASTVLGLPRDLGRSYSAGGAVAAATRFVAGDAAYVANLENHPRAVRRLMRDRRLLGNPPEVLARARDPVALARAVRAVGGRAPVLIIDAAHVFPRPEAVHAGTGATATSVVARPAVIGSRRVGSARALGGWLRKPRQGGGGSGITRWRPGAVLAPHELVQEYIEGVPASAAFAADGRRAVVLGLARQLVGEAAFGATGFRFCGCLFPLPVPRADGARLLEAVRALANALTAAFGLRGVNGLDFMVRDGEPWVLELNPRYTASMELIERAYGRSIYALHERACGGELPDWGAAAVPAGVFGKAIVFARRDVVARGTAGWLERDDVRDVPFTGDQIPRGHPICTAFAHGPDADVCYARLVETAEALREEIEGRADGDPATE